VIPLGSSAVIGTGAGSSSSLDFGGVPVPGEFFGCRIPVRESETTHHDVDLAVDRLGAVEGQVLGTLPEGSRLSYGMIIGGRPRPHLPFGGTVRPNGGLFRLTALFPVRYRFWIDGQAASTEAEVRRAQTSRVVLAAAGS